jgi:hypothetical protein
MRKLLGSMAMIAAVALGTSAFACDMHQAASTDGQTVATATVPPAAGSGTTTTTTPKSTESNTGG